MKYKDIWMVFTITDNTQLSGNDQKYFNRIYPEWADKFTVKMHQQLLDFD